MRSGGVAPHVAEAPSRSLDAQRHGQGTVGAKATSTFDEPHPERPSGVLRGEATESVRAALTVAERRDNLVQRP